jgi:glycosyltransferase involved in cell wall biosynthesis
LIVVPAYNEQLVIGATLDGLLAGAPEFDVLVVDDGSVDETATCAATVGVPVVSIPFNVGVGGAMRAGFLYAVRNGYDAVVQFDADGQHDPAYINDLIDGLDSADVVVGSRFRLGDSFRIGHVRRLAMRILAASISRICHTRITDATSGFRASGPRAIALFARYYPAEYLGDTVESLVVAGKSGLIVIEVPVVMRARAGGKSSQNLVQSSAYLARALLVLLLAVIRNDRRIGLDIATPGIPPGEEVPT